MIDVVSCATYDRCVRRYKVQICSEIVVTQNNKLFGFETRIGPFYLRTKKNLDDSIIALSRLLLNLHYSITLQMRRHSFQYEER